MTASLAAMTFGLTAVASLGGPTRLEPGAHAEAAEKASLLRAGPKTAAFPGQGLGKGLEKLDGVLQTLTPSPTAEPTSSASPTPEGTESAGDTPAPTPSDCSISAILVPSCGLWWGVAPGAFTPVPVEEAHREFERDSGVHVPITHTYYRGDQLFPTPAQIELAREPGRERLLFMNWKVAQGYTWAQVASGQADSRIDRLAAHLRSSFPERFFLSVHHEPENDVNAQAGSGMTAQDYARMFRHTVQRLRARGVTNAITVMSYMGYAPWCVKPWFNDLYPGDDVVDWIAWDPYAFGRPSGYGAWDFATLVNNDGGFADWIGMYEWAEAKHPNKPLMLAEWGVYEYWEDLSQSRKAWFYDTVAAQLDRFPRFKGLIYFDTPHDQEGRSTAVDSTQKSLDAFRRLSQDPRFIKEWNGG